MLEAHDVVGVRVGVVFIANVILVTVDFGTDCGRGRSELCLHVQWWSSTRVVSFFVSAGRVPDDDGAVLEADQEGGS